MRSTIDLFSTKGCVKCEALSMFLSAKGIKYNKRVISDEDPESETDALMLNIVAAPALVRDGKVLRTRDIFNSSGHIDEDKVRSFVRE